MSKPRYCLKCGEATGREPYVKSLDTQGRFVQTYCDVCYNPKCPREGLMSFIANDSKPKVKKEKRKP